MALLTVALLTYCGSTYCGSTYLLWPHYTQDPTKLLTEYEATQAELGSTRLLVRQLEQQLAGRAAEEEAELRRRQAEARQAGGRSAQEVLP
jgi:hypothetical protein